MATGMAKAEPLYASNPDSRDEHNSTFAQQNSAAYPHMSWMPLGLRKPVRPSLRGPTTLLLRAGQS